MKVKIADLKVGDAIRWTSHLNSDDWQTFIVTEKDDGGIIYGMGLKTPLRAEFPKLDLTDNIDTWNSNWSYDLEYIAKKQFKTDLKKLLED